MSLIVDIEKSYGDYTLRMDFDIENTTLAILGASGCGKSLTLRCIAGIDTPDRGRIVLNDRVLFDSEKGIDVRVQKRNTALLFQNYQLFSTMNVHKNIESGMKRKSDKQERERRIGELLDLFRLGGLDQRYPHELSGGQQQRVALARMLASDPDVLMFDEPFSALDESLKIALEPEILKIIETFPGSILYVSHDIEESYRFADDIVVLENGRITDFGPSKRVIEEPRSLAALKLSGIRNISRARKAGPRSVLTLDWGLLLETAEDVPDDIRHVAIRDHEVVIDRPDRPNTFRACVVRTSETIHRKRAIFSTDPDINVTDDQSLRTLVTFDFPKRSKLPDLTEGVCVNLSFPPEALHLVRR